MRIILGTGNAKKLRELQLTLPREGLTLGSLADFPDALDVEETGQTFAENARLKACRQAVHLGQWVMSDDSGLAVDALDGAPGIYSARYAGTHGDDDANNAKLLDALESVPDDRRGASFICALCLSDPDGNPVIETDGHCRGRIGREYRGRTGFGYDPLFIIPEYHRTFAELDLAVKRAISHRAVAMRKFAPRLAALVAAK